MTVDPDVFVELSTVLTGFDAFELHATGMVERYLETAVHQVGEAGVERLVQDLERESNDPDRLTDTLALDIARAITQMWYLGAWPKLLPSSHVALEREDANVTFMVAPEAYVEGLVWRTFGGHPPGAKPPGFGTWAEPPRIVGPPP